MPETGVAPSTSRNRGWRRAADTLQTALFFALLAGLLEAGTILAWSHVMGRFAWVSRDQIWMAPLAYAAFFLPVAVSLVVIEWLLPRRVPRLAATFLFAFAAFFSLTLPFGQLAHWSTVPLALGVAAVVGRLAGAHPLVHQRIVRTGSLALLASVAALAWAVPTARRWGQDRALAALPRAAAGAPNILLLILDTVRASDMGLYGYPEPNTPGIERQAQHGLVFTRAFSAAPWTLASHASIFTGHRARDFDLNLRHPFHRDFLTLASALRANGYATGGFIANYNYTGHDSGLQRGFIAYEDYLRSPREFFASTAPGQTAAFRTLLNHRSVGQFLRIVAHPDLTVPPTRWSQFKHADLVNEQFLAWSRTVRGHPFFAFLNYMDAHAPYYCPPPYAERFQCHRSRQNTYVGAIAYLDAQISLLLQRLRAAGILDNTIVVIAADHGDQFGEHGLQGHGNSLYLDLLHVPLVIFGPGVSRGRIDAPVSLRDLPATLEDLAGIHSAAFPGYSLLRLVPGRGGGAANDSTVVASPVFSSYGMRGFREGAVSEIGPEYHRIVKADGRVELYDYVADPRETHDLARGSAPDPVGPNGGS